MCNRKMTTSFVGIDDCDYPDYPTLTASSDAVNKFSTWSFDIVAVARAAAEEAVLVRSVDGQTALVESQFEESGQRPPHDILERLTGWATVRHLQRVQVSTFQSLVRKAFDDSLSEEQRKLCELCVAVWCELNENGTIRYTHCLTGDYTHTSACWLRNNDDLCAAAGTCLADPTNANKEALFLIWHGLLKKGVVYDAKEDACRAVLRHMTGSEMAAAIRSVREIDYKVKLHAFYDEIETFHKATIHGDAFYEPYGGTGTTSWNEMIYAAATRLIENPKDYGDTFKYLEAFYEWRMSQLLPPGSVESPDEDAWINKPGFRKTFEFKAMMFSASLMMHFGLRL